MLLTIQYFTCENSLNVIAADSECGIVPRRYRNFVFMISRCCRRKMLIGLEKMVDLKRRILGISLCICGISENGLLGFEI